VSGPLVAVLDYGIGNLRSAQKGLQRAGADAHLTADPALVADAAAVVLPGVGAFGRCMDALHRTGLAQVAVDAAASGRPFLGICVGMQLMYDGSDESPGAAGLGIQPGTVRRLPGGVKHPQMQWNVLEPSRPSRLLADVAAGSWVYFVHSYAAPDGPDTVATCDYGGPVTAAIERDNIAATQFHPEKSGDVGLGILASWVRGVTATVAA
jgi:imidazole glycerol-phosphate synthase subunit HisH